MVLAILEHAGWLIPLLLVANWLLPDPRKRRRRR